MKFGKLQEFSTILDYQMVHEFLDAFTRPKIAMLKHFWIERKNMTENKSNWQSLLFREILGFDSQGNTIASRALFLDVKARRSETYPLLWELIGDICPPKLMGGVFNPSNAITRDQMLTIANNIDRWYCKHGAIMDSSSRLWLIALRERCFSWLAINKLAENTLTWSKKNPQPGDNKPRTALRLWLVKTALRISLNQNLIATDLSKEETGADWMKNTGYQIFHQLLLNYDVVCRAWSDVNDLDLPDSEQVKKEISSLIDKKLLEDEQGTKKIRKGK